ncbi:lysozyme inhibitor LprI family protein [Psychrobacter aestuarii]|uniref:DUF1311 domain-containing protein n=1 Tax=Psychrobacter aestuarii TaxID=556327 RepID=A0ABN0VJV5_9GAMM|nr:lysozyme inhibitor LprI family protein [Psychrobacter aestuarii]
MKKLLLVSVFFSSCYLLPVYANAASFDCNKAATWVEKTICKNNELSELDEAMAKKYSKSLNDIANEEDADIYRKNLIIDQKLWLSFQRNTCKDIECLVREYKEYLDERSYYDITWSYPDELSTSDLPKQSSFGSFSYTFDLPIYNSDTGKFDEQIATNTLSINEVDNKPYLSVIDSTLFFTNLHSCVIEESLATWSQNHWTISDNRSDSTTELRLYPGTYKGKFQLLLKDTGDQFRQERCGVRGYFDGILLNRE